jgi:hypothetical protein
MSAQPAIHVVNRVGMVVTSSDRHRTVPLDCPTSIAASYRVAED